MSEQLARLSSYLSSPASPVAVVIAGVALAFASGLVPFGNHAFQLLPLQVAAGVLPYVLFGMIAWMLHEPQVWRYGLLVLGVHLVAAIVQRGLIGGGGWLLIATPLLLAAALLMLWPRALRASAPRPAADDSH